MHHYHNFKILLLKTEYIKMSHTLMSDIIFGGRIGSSKMMELKSSKELCLIMPTNPRCVNMLLHLGWTVYFLCTVSLMHCQSIWYSLLFCKSTTRQFTCIEVFAVCIWQRCYQDTMLGQWLLWLIWVRARMTHNGIVVIDATSSLPKEWNTTTMQMSYWSCNLFLEEDNGKCYDKIH